MPSLLQRHKELENSEIPCILLNPLHSELFNDTLH